MRGSAGLGRSMLRAISATASHRRLRRGRHERIARRASTLAACAAFSVLTIVTGVHAADSRIVVRVYDIGDAAADVRAAAIREAAAIVQDAGVAIEWHDCTKNVDQPACGKSAGHWNLIARILPTFVPASGAHSSVTTGNRLVDADSQLGVAVFDPSAQTDALATVFDDQVQIVARRTGVERSELLGRALAHEIGHLLLGTDSHSAAGIMRARWSPENIKQARLGMLMFSSQQAEQMRAEVCRRRNTSKDSADAVAR